jgi:hypothetical protein
MDNDSATFFPRTIWTFILIMITLSVGNYLGDQATLRDCASTGKAIMRGGGTISCEVVKEVK